ncbi:CD9 antigen-like [Uloborus diversus]|uniref:CD9 antigen-like n=1 Tax=Uloborus diversus TaxID=327109 RepID=UPI00240963E3|nr:CD9 antigen-like [Uloborus diversus]
MGLAGCYACMKYLVVIFNLIFWLAGIGVLAVSVWLYLDSSVYLGNTEDSYAYFVAIFVLMAAGAIMFLIGLLGCCGALQESPCMLGTFFIFLLVIFAAEITGGVWAWMYKDEVNKIIEIQVTKMVKDEYGASKSVENTIDAVQHDLHCCGAMQPSDWAHSRLNSKDKSAVEVGISKSLGFYTLPATCCKSKNPDVCEIHRKVKFAGQIFDGIYNEGCIPRLQRYFEENMVIMIGIGIGIGVIQMLGLVFSMALCCAIRSE